MSRIESYSTGRVPQTETTPSSSSGHLSIDQNIIELSKANISKDISKLAAAKAFGLPSCDGTWNESLAKTLIYEMFECSGGESLTQGKVDCLLGKLSENLSVNCCK